MGFSAHGTQKLLCTESIAFNSIPCILKQTHVQERVTRRKVERSMNVLYGKETTWDFCFNVWKATVKKWHLPKKIRMRTMSLNCRRKILLDRSKTTVTNTIIKKEMDCFMKSWALKQRTNEHPWKSHTVVQCTTCIYGHGPALKDMMALS